MSRLQAILAILATLPVLAQAQNYAITGATVHPLNGDGTLNSATVLVSDGRIEAIGVVVDVPDGYEVIDARGKVVTPGIFDPLSRLGAVEVDLESVSVDNSHSGRYSAGFDIADGLNPRSTVIDVNRIEGVTRALVVPQPVEGGHVLGGRAAVVRLTTGDDFLLRRGAAVVAFMGETGAELAGGSRGAAVSMLREALQDAIDYNRHREEFDAGQRRDYSVSRIDLDALLPVVSGRTPLIVYADRASDLRAALAIADDFDIELIIAGGAEAWLVADQLARQDVPVILQPLLNLPSGFGRINATLENAARLHAAGVTIAFSAADGHNPRNLTQAAGNAVANGLPWDAALAAITVNAAAMFGQRSGCCTLEAGNAADLVIWSGDPLEVTTFADQVFVGGEKISMRSRQTLLRDRYMNLDGDWPPAYRTP